MYIANGGINSEARESRSSKVIAGNNSSVWRGEPGDEANLKTQSCTKQLSWLSSNHSYMYIVCKIKVK